MAQKEKKLNSVIYFIGDCTSQGSVNNFCKLLKAISCKSRGELFSLFAINNIHIFASKKAVTSKN